MSHELRTPLNAILGFATLLKKSLSINSIEKQNLETIHRSGEHLLSLINEILEFAKIEAGKISINPIKINLYNTLEEIKSLFESRCSSKGLEFNFNMHTNLPKFVKCDEKRLRQIFINLLGNALKFTNEGSISVDLNFKNSRLIVQIKDSGIGMSESSQKLIFKPFEQIDEEKHKQEGTGLGLAITKELIEKMNGFIKVTSKENIGTTFDFEIDMQVCDDIETLEISPKKEIISINLKKNLNILVADDTKANRDLLVQLLQSYSLTTYEANDGLEVLEICKEVTFDLIFMDILMPNLDGLETIKILKMDEKSKNIPIIAISANVFDEDKQKAINSGADYFLTKPFIEQDITTALKKFLDIKFVYEEDKQIDENKIYLDEKTAKEICTAATKLDGNTILNILEKNEINSSTKTKIRSLLNEYRFNDIIKLIDLMYK